MIARVLLSVATALFLIELSLCAMLIVGVVPAIQSFMNGIVQERLLATGIFISIVITAISFASSKAKTGVIR
jgi:hypothetical protein